MTEYCRNRYATDPEFAERRREASRLAYYKKQGKEPPKKKIQTVEVSVQTEDRTAMIGEGGITVEEMRQVIREEFRLMMGDFMKNRESVEVEPVKETNENIYTKKDIIELFNNNETITENTKKNYKSRLIRICDLLEIEENCDVIQKLNDVEGVKEKVYSAYDNDTTRKSFFTSILNILKTIGFDGTDIQKQYMDIHTELKEGISSIRKDNKKTNKDFKWDDLLKAYQEKKDTLPEKLKLVAGLYILRPPIRSEYARNVMITDEMEEYPNTISFSKEKVMLRLTDFKSAHSIGEYKYEFSGELNEMVRNHIKKRGNGKTFLSFKELTLQNKIKQIIKNLMGVEAGLQEMRRSYEGYLQNSKEYLEASINQRSEMHRHLLHTQEIAQEYRRV